MNSIFYPSGCEIDPADPVGSRRKCLEANAQQEGLSTQAPMLPTKVADVDADIAAIWCQVEILMADAIYFLF